MRVKWGFPSSANPGNLYFFDLSDGTLSNRVIAWIGAANNIDTSNYVGGTGESAASSSVSFNVGDTMTTIFAWDSGQLYVSVNGSSFTSHVRSLGIPPGITTFDVGSRVGSAEIDSSILWFACGTGTLSDSDAATINSWGNSVPKRSSFPASAQATMVWNGASPTGSLK